MNPSTHLAMGQHIWSSYFYAIGNKIPQHFWAIMNPSITSGDGPTQCHQQYLVWSVLANSRASAVPLWRAVGPTRSHRQRDPAAILGPHEPISCIWDGPTLCYRSISFGTAWPFLCHQQQDPTAILSHHESIGHIWRWASPMPSAVSHSECLGQFYSIGSPPLDGCWAHLKPFAAQSHSNSGPS